MIETEGGFVFLYCRMYTVKCILVIVYIPPPFFRDFLQTLLVYLLGNPDVPPLLLEDFNGYLNPTPDRHLLFFQGVKGRGTTLSHFVQQVGWMDLWRSHYTPERHFSCLFKSHISLSRIDLCIGKPSVIPFINMLVEAFQTISLYWCR